VELNVARLARLKPFHGLKAGKLLLKTEKDLGGSVEAGSRLDRLSNIRVRDFLAKNMGLCAISLAFQKP
jgi:hypothetical protein